MSYPGGKGGAGVAQALINLMPPHSVYVEAFLGAGSVMRQKRPAVLNVGLERSPATAEQTRLQIRDLATLDVTVYDRWIPSSELLVAAGIAKSDVALSGGIAKSNDVNRRPSPLWTVLERDALTWLESYSNLLPANTLVYCDPPYVRSARRGGRDLYEFEMTDVEHVKLLTLLKTLKCHVMISGYFSDLYSSTLAGWNTSTFQTTVRSGATATEWVWFNYPKPVELHDYRFLGSRFRERERIKRKVKRWTAKLEKMPVLERQALLCAMRDEQ